MDCRNHRGPRRGADREPGRKAVLEQKSAVEAIASPLGVAGPGADHALLAAELVALAGRFIERTRNVRLDRIAVGATGIAHIDRKRGTGALHGNRLAVAAALLESGG